MKAWVATSLDGEDGLQLQELPSPQCGSEQIRITNHAVALNFPDVLITRGKYQLRLEPPFVPGSESAGVVTEVGADVTEVAVGDRVLTVCGVGAFADEVVVTPSLQQVHVIPDDMRFTDAAGFGMVHGTALHGLRQRGVLQPGESVLVLGSGGGCGSAAVGVAVAMGARVIAAASSPEKCAVAAELGADHVVNYATEDLRERVMDITMAPASMSFSTRSGAPSSTRRAAASDGTAATWSWGSPPATSRSCRPTTRSSNQWPWSVSRTECPRSRIRP
jgi:NADPH2:quinone reductase